MNIAIIGAGNMGTSLGRLWSQHGHRVMFSYSRTPRRLEELAAEIGSLARSGSPTDAVRFADAVFLAVRWEDVRDAISAAGSFGGRPLISCVNPSGAEGLEVGLTTSAAEEISRLAPGAAVVEAFNTVSADTLAYRAHRSGANTPTVFYCGDDRNAMSSAAGLIRDAGLHPVDAGPLRNARYLEPLAMLMTDLAQPYRRGSNIALKLVSPAGANERFKRADGLARDFAEVFAASGIAKIEDVLAEDFVVHLPYNRFTLRGREKFAVWMGELHSAFGNFQCGIDELIVDGERAAVRWTWSGTHSHSFLGMAPTGRTVEFSETHLLRVSGDRIAEDHVSANVVDLLDQLAPSRFIAA
jgi:steroid delta-isomerase-like uncharacterized protein